MLENSRIISKGEADKAPTMSLSKISQLNNTLGMKQNLNITYSKLLGVVLL